MAAYTFHARKTPNFAVDSPRSNSEIREQRINCHKLFTSHYSEDSKAALWSVGFVKGMMISPNADENIERTYATGRMVGSVDQLALKRGQDHHNEQWQPADRYNPLQVDSHLWSHRNNRLHPRHPGLYDTMGIGNGAVFLVGGLMCEDDNPHPYQAHHCKQELTYTLNKQCADLYHQTIHLLAQQKLSSKPCVTA